MANYSTNEFKAGLKILIDGDPYAIVENEMVKPGKGQAFNRVRVRNLKTGRTIERTWKSGDTVEAADVVDTDMQYLYREGDFFNFMVPDTYEQLTASKEAVGDGAQWLKDGTVCVVTLWNGVPLQVVPPAHMSHGSGAFVHQRRRDLAHRHAHRRILVTRQGLGLPSGVVDRERHSLGQAGLPQGNGDQPVEA
jgi:translation elongation factor P